MTRIAVVGDFNEQVTAHVAINASLDALKQTPDDDLDYEWVATPDAEQVDFTAYDGIWCTPASPYESEAGALRAIHYARTTGTPFFGSCGGYQYAVLEFARNVLGLVDADNTEVNPDTPTPVISGLSCSLVEVTDSVDLESGSRAAALNGDTRIMAAYHCSYGVNRIFIPEFDGSDMYFCGFDAEQDPRVFEHRSHPFFIGTAFQPERAALDGPPHALVSAFVDACLAHGH